MLRPDVPLMNSVVNAQTREIFLKQIKAADARRVWIAFDRSTLFEERGADLERLGENLRFFEQNGLEAGVWFQAYGFGEPLLQKREWTRIRALSGVERSEADCFCPEDPDFMAAYLNWVADIAKLHPRLMMLDDDLCLSVRPGIGCFCPRHRKLLGFDDASDLFIGGPNPKRETFLQVMGETHRRFCRRVREAVDGVDPTIRVGLCAGYTSWDLEGTDPPELARILAGSTEPFFRLTAAPYWVAPKKNRFPGQRLSAVIENARNQAAWCKEMEFFAEADSYPRPCYHTPAMLVENFDIAMHASGIPSLKYLFDYFSSPEYEQQYWKIHTRNLPLYERLEQAFAEASYCGVQVWRPPHRMARAHLPHKWMGEKPLMERYFSRAAAMLACQGIPVSYEGESDYAVIFGNDALDWKNHRQRAVVDLPAALLLQQQGMDLGICRMADAPAPRLELFEGERMQVAGVAGCKALTLKPEAVIESRFDHGAVASFTYGNFLILNFDADASDEGSAIFCSYQRGAQLRRFFGNPYPAICGYADVYCLSARRGNRWSVLFLNLSMDPIFDFDIQLPKPCRSFTLYGAEGKLQGSKIHLGGTFAPQAALLLELEE